ncbi:hypothetical protein [Flammeovirga sp. OC4]|uniref:hypothetical protein n=1 Tax=Flammeovirga sp. OC4 TaxID=1382345 RepID=UPI0012DFEDAA|nr:hypothetical protein [Flammeovirga sp. OC4]
MSKLFSCLSTFVLLVLPYFSYCQYVLEEGQPLKQNEYSALRWLDKDFEQMSFSNYSKGVFYFKVRYKTEESKEYDFTFDIYSDDLISINEVKSGENHGEYFLFDRSKRLRVQGNYMEGVKTGRWVDYFFYDSFIKEYIYKNNEEFVNTIRTHQGDTIVIEGDGTIKFQVEKDFYYHELYKNGVVDYSYIFNQKMDTTYLKTDQPAVLRSEYELKKHLKQYLKGIRYEIYHQMELKMWILVDKDGNVTDVEMKKGFTDLLNRNLIKGLKETKGLWSGATLNNEVVPSFYEYSVLLFDIVKPIKSKDLNTPMVTAGPAFEGQNTDKPLDFLKGDNINTRKQTVYNNTSRDGVLSHNYGNTYIRSDNSSSLKQDRKARRLELKDLTQKKLRKTNFQNLLKQKNIIPHQ